LSLVSSKQCGCGWWLHSSVNICIECPKCKSLICIAGLAATSNVVVNHVASSPWQALHSYAPTNATKWNPATARQWYDTEWTQLIPSCGECRQHWAELTKQHPPDFSSARAFFEWAWARHNDVSTMHSKRPTITLEEAYTVYWS